MLILYAVTLFLSAVMLFASELMYAKMLLPFLGGTPAVWNTCTVFFQIGLLAGYAYAHAAVSRLKIRQQVILHLVLLLVPLAVLPIAIKSGWRPPSEANPIPQVFWLMAMTIGLPFVMVSTSAPLIQRWFAHTDHPAASDPYFLYAASNAGSFTGLIGYLLFLEPRFTLKEQSHLWHIGYVMLIVLAAICAATVLLSLKKKEATLPEIDIVEGIAVDSSGGLAGGPVTRRRIVKWLVLALIPSSLMLGLTTFLTTDIAAVPLLWVMPLSLYLLSFILAFARQEYIPQRVLVNLVPVLVVLQAISLLPGIVPMPWIAILHMGTFFIIALACHRELANDRPSTEHLTKFYLMLSVGGMLGGMFNALAAPVIFNDAYEYTIALILAGVVFLRRKFYMDGKQRVPGGSLTLKDSAWLVVFGAALFGVIRVLGKYHPGLSESALVLLLTALAAVCYTAYRRPVLFGLAVAIAFYFVGMTLRTGGNVVYQERSFFGVLKVQFDAANDVNRVWHGTTLHGLQWQRDQETRELPISYFFPTGPIGQYLSSPEGVTGENKAVLGLGAGTMAAYTNRGQKMTFYEIDPVMRDIATNDKYFSYISDARARGVDVRIVLGDGRLTISDAPEHSYDFIGLDAFSSDSIPMHLLTREALNIYRSKLKDTGVIAFNITNRYVNIEPVLGNLAADAGMACIVRYDSVYSDEEWRMGKFPSAWVLIAPHPSNFASLLTDPTWIKVERDPSVRTWTDDYTNLLQVLMFFRKPG